MLQIAHLFFMCHCVSFIDPLAIMTPNNRLAIRWTAQNTKKRQHSKWILKLDIFSAVIFSVSYHLKHILEIYDIEISSSMHSDPIFNVHISWKLFRILLTCAPIKNGFISTINSKSSTQLEFAGEYLCTHQPSTWVLIPWTWNRGPSIYCLCWLQGYLLGHILYLL